MAPAACSDLQSHAESHLESQPESHPESHLESQPESQFQSQSQFQSHPQGFAQGFAQLTHTRKPPSPPLTAACSPAEPAPASDLLARYALHSLARQASRVDPQGLRKKLRKSYKGHIADLPGRNDIPRDAFLRDLLARPDALFDSVSLDPGLVNIANFTFIAGPVPGFDSSLLGLDDHDHDPQNDRESSASPARDGAPRKKKKACPPPFLL
ncbi:Mediator of RNA polymerase II transcription subunit 19 [Neolecta irregularis DAH-3]|uniref:Mediator of RNA polymerase II transcription subunit 19 n=1 Tax=Neolecta irregularis (strain DAH-3) TaxID=1198029 RepID=A0A1U7LKJ0_NEOID|nr:Mediator of RNA polymerase II transcription subunit 19 [Neolecta irregularis DAH-3]|eukprot:OLL23167.1 Mediator of RNA polymerase II transcription subunit 19 [Neolecta irregularis DAH-3]